MWPTLDWGWGMGFHMLLWWLLLAAGLIAVAALVFNGFSRRGDGDASRRTDRRA